MLVNGFDAWLTTSAGTVALTSQRYTPDVLHPDGVRRIEQFDHDPWPHWTFHLDDGTRVEHEVFVRHGSSLTALSWHVQIPRGKAMLTVRPCSTGRDYHALHHENPLLQFTPLANDARLTWHLYPGLPGLVSLSNGCYRHCPDWYRRVLYAEEGSEDSIMWRMSLRRENSNGTSRINARSGFWRLKEPTFLHVRNMMRSNHIFTRFVRPNGDAAAAFRPNQIFAVGGLPYSLIEGTKVHRIVKAVEQHLWTPMGLRTLAPGEPGYVASYCGGVPKRDAAYHQERCGRGWQGRSPKGGFVFMARRPASNK